MTIDYKKAGVDIDAGDRLVDWLQESKARGPQASNVVGGIGGFAALFRVNFQHMKKPLLVSSTDGVGTKVLLAVHSKRFDTVGQDLVAMCANDLITCGATPLFFLDYYAVGKLQLDEAKIFLSGVRKACEESQCVLIGGETAEMPGVYRPGDFDCAGFIVGVVDEVEMLGAHLVQPDDVVIGVSSSGFHSNGYSLLRKAFEKDLDKWIDTLMTPTALYASMAGELRDAKLVHAMANITGGGVHNVPRVVPKGLGVVIQDWEWPEPFKEVQRRTGMNRDEMLKTLNCGLGFALIAPKKNEEAIHAIVRKHGHRSFQMGTLEKHSGEPKVLNAVE